MDILSKMSSGGGGAAQSPVRGGGSGQTQQTPRADFSTGDGSMQSCGQLPPNVEKDRREALAFRQSCAITRASGNQRMAINDYSCESGAPQMYLFDADGQCVMKTSAAFGSGMATAGSASCPLACSTNASRLTPPGFHITATHNGREYKDHNSLGLTGLEGQQSKKRFILIHGSNNPGEAVTWGCTGVSHESFKKVQSYLGKGALVYNSFKSSQLAPSCRDSEGISRSGSCRLDAGGSSPPSGGSGSGATTSMLDRLRRGLAHLGFGRAEHFE